MHRGADQAAQASFSAWFVQRGLRLGVEQRAFAQAQGDDQRVLVGKVQYSEPILTPARCATAFVLRPSRPLVSRMRAVASSIVATVCPARACRGSLRGLREGRFFVVTMARMKASNGSHSTGADMPRLRLIDEVVLDQINDVGAASVQHRLDRIQRRAEYL